MFVTYNGRTVKIDCTSDGRYWNVYRVDKRGRKRTLTGWLFELTTAIDWAIYSLTKRR